MKRTTVRLAAAACATTLVLTGCGRDSESGDGAAAAGVTTKPCPEAVDKDKGCIYLGVISDLSGAFKGVGVPYTDGQRAFWKKVNEDGGIGDYEVDVTTYVKDNAYDPTKHAQAFAQIKDDVLALAQSLGTAQTEGILADAKAEDILITPATAGSNWIFEDIATVTGPTYCGDAMNAVDYAVDVLGAKSIAAVHFPGDYGDDTAVGTKIAAEVRGVKFTDIPTGPGADKQTAALAALKKASPDVVAVGTGPAELAALVGGAAAAGFRGKFLGAIPSWNAALLETPAAPALEALYMQTSAFPTWDADTPGYEAMREAAGDTPPNDYFALGWAASYPLKAVLEKAAEDDDLDRAGAVKAAGGITSVDGEGMLPEGSGNLAGNPNERATRTTYINKVDRSTSTGVAPTGEALAGPTLADYTFEQPCFLMK